MKTKVLPEIAPIQHLRASLVATPDDGISFFSHKSLCKYILQVWLSHELAGVPEA
jgi:hypothetical protein